MSVPFTHPEFRTYAFEDVPVEQDLLLMDVKWLRDWEAAQIEFFNGGADRIVGYISWVAVRAVGDSILELSWYPNTSDRFHEVHVHLPRSAFVACVDMPNYSDRTRVFVTGDWLTGLHRRPYTAFALIDAIGVRAALREEKLTSTRLATLRSRIDKLAQSTPGVAFVSFADSLLLKINWYIGQYDDDISYSYDPETLIRLLPTIADLFREELGLSVYGIVAQGGNEYSDSALLHVSESGSHVSLNSLGIPFAQIMAIEHAVREAIRAGHHGMYDIYLDETFFNSLRFEDYKEKQKIRRWNYKNPMEVSGATYYGCNLARLLYQLTRPDSVATNRA